MENDVIFTQSGNYYSGSDEVEQCGGQQRMDGISGYDGHIRIFLQSAVVFTLI